MPQAPHRGRRILVSILAGYSSLLIKFVMSTSGDSGIRAFRVLSRASIPGTQCQMIWF